MLLQASTLEIVDGFALSDLKSPLVRQLAFSKRYFRVLYFDAENRPWILRWSFWVGRADGVTAALAEEVLAVVTDEENASVGVGDKIQMIWEEALAVRSEVSMGMVICD